MIFIAYAIAASSLVGGACYLIIHGHPVIAVFMLLLFASIKVHTN